MDKYLLSFNPLNENSGAYIFQTTNPRCLIECVQLTDEEQTAIDYNAVEIKEIFQVFEFKREGEKQYWKLAIGEFLDYRNTLEVVSDVDTLKRSYKSIERAWRWLRAYLEEGGQLPKKGQKIKKVFKIEDFNAANAKDMVDVAYIEELNLILGEIQDKANELGKAYRHTGQNVLKVFKPLRDKTKKELIKRKFKIVDANEAETAKSGLYCSIYW